MLRIVDTVGYLLFLTKLAALLTLPNHADSQNLPRSGGSFDIDVNMFHETKALPDGKEVSMYLYANESKRFFFLVEVDAVPLSITVTPCAAPLNWQLLHDLPDEPSGDNADYDPLMEQKIAGKPGASTVKVLQNFTGDERMTYRHSESSSGVYTLILTSIGGDSVVKMYATTTPDSDHAYPALPVDHSVNVIGFTAKTITLTWKPSPDEPHFAKELEYCISVYKKKNFKSHCSVLSHLNGDPVPTLPPHWGFGFPWEAAKAKALKQKARPIKAARPGAIFYKCIGQKTRFIYNKAKPGRTYHADVYVRNSATNRSSAYKGTVVKTNGKVLAKLRDGRVKNVVLRKSRPIQHFQYKVTSPIKEALLMVHPCKGSVKLEVMKGDAIILKAKVKRLQTFSLKNLASDLYVINVGTTRKRRKSVRVLITSNISKFPYPKLPDDSSIFVFENLTTCNSVTLAWMGTDENQNYCLYSKEHTITKRNRRLARHDQCIGPGKRSKTEKVTCRRFKHRNKSRAVLTETVRGLKPDTGYIFDVYVRRRGRISLAYKSVWVQTREHC